MCWESAPKWALTITHKLDHPTNPSKTGIIHRSLFTFFKNDCISITSRVAKASCNTNINSIRSIVSLRCCVVCCLLLVLVVRPVRACTRKETHKKQKNGVVVGCVLVGSGCSGSIVLVLHSWVWFCCCWVILFVVVFVRWSYLNKKNPSLPCFLSSFLHPKQITPNTEKQDARSFLLARCWGTYGAPRGLAS